MKRFLLSLLLLLGGGTFAADAKISGKADKPMTVGSFNIRCPGDKAPNTWEERIPRIVKVLDQYDFDIVGLQEVAAKQLDMLLKKTRYKSIGVARDDGIRKGEFSCIFYRKDRFEKISYGTFWLSETPDKVGSISWKSACRRICTWAKFRDRKTDKVFFFFNTHLDHRSAEARLEGTRLILNRIREIAGDAPVILTGDFNHNFGEPYQLTVKTLQDAWVTGKGPEARATFSGYRESRLKESSACIDYIFISPGIRVDRILCAHDRFDGFPSDHDPVVATVRLP